MLREGDQNETKAVDRIELRGKTSAYCPICEMLVDLAADQELASTFRIGPARTEELAKTGFIHRLHNKKAKVMVCKNSLLQYFNGRRSVTFNLKALDTQAALSGDGE